MTEDEEVELLAILDDEYARSILIETSKEPMGAETLAERCDASPPTIYRRIDRLDEHDLLESQQQLDPDGHHYKTYAARLERVAVEIEDGEMEIDIHRRDEDPADRFTRLYEEL
ncbi:winged helix-turn-helix domain-containing protein [Natranaeroarchaeum aerophilus]|uniref:Winged helix-turn-helix domain-containing protein n=1 Tax=Natranaeroarchaeum aerophilus TaxID=2917711 RepID=A0AAE3FTD8_9EURY|nr:winged helix-turn-helix domain-containing protein [Natranaeroarchaeum aerophilus]MCL9815242.1 winged helix-turn-helix domain-containing protein [Natranaeroarchaeum aerophilus]